MEIKVKYRNGKLLSNNKDIILNNVANIHEIAKNDPFALSTKLLYGIIKDEDDETMIVFVAPVRSLADESVIYLYMWNKWKKSWQRLAKFDEERTLFDSYDECLAFYMEKEFGVVVDDDDESGKTIADELLDEADEQSREENDYKNFDELCARVKKIEEYRKLTAEIAKAKAKLKNADCDFKFADEEYKKSLDKLNDANREVESNRAVRDNAKKVKDECYKAFKELDNRRAELDIKNDDEVLIDSFWDGFFAQCFGGK